MPTNNPNETPRPTMTEKFKERIQREDEAVDAINDYCNETPLTVAELLPCPFAHYSDQVRLIGDLPPQLNNENDSWWISCPVCGVSTVSYLRPKSAELAWNNRKESTNE